MQFYEGYTLMLQINIHKLNNPASTGSGSWIKYNWKKISCLVEVRGYGLRFTELEIIVSKNTKINVFFSLSNWLEWSDVIDCLESGKKNSEGDLIQ